MKVRSSGVLYCHLQRLAKDVFVLLSYSQAELGRKYTQPRKHFLAKPCRLASTKCCRRLTWQVCLFTKVIFLQYVQVSAKRLKGWVNFVTALASYHFSLALPAAYSSNLGTTLSQALYVQYAIKTYAMKTWAWAWGMSCIFERLCYWFNVTPNAMP